MRVTLPHTISYRMYDHWVTRGYIKGGNPGSGTHRSITPFEQEVLNTMAVLVDAGFQPSSAARVARRAVRGLHAHPGKRISVSLSKDIKLVFGAGADPDA